VEASLAPRCRDILPRLPKLPDFLIIGAPKAGTTALFRALSRHPRIYCSPEKEPRFFAYAGTTPRFPCPGGRENAACIVSREADYLRLFAGCAPDQVAGEASTAYLAAPGAPATAFRYVPSARLVAILRHPVERAHSQWLHHRQEGHEPLADFEQAWHAEPERIARGFRPSFHYRERGYYGRHLQRWLAHFPREQLLVLFYEDWQGQPQATLTAVFRHLGVASMARPIVTRENRSSRQPRWAWLHHHMVENNALRRWAQRRLPLRVRDAITNTIGRFNLKPGPGLDARLRARLAVAYHQDLAQLEALTDRDLSAWRT
jgi:hypothetical protein